MTSIAKLSASIPEEQIFYKGTFFGKLAEKVAAKESEDRITAVWEMATDYFVANAGLLQQEDWDLIRNHQISPDYTIPIKVRPNFSYEEMSLACTLIESRKLISYIEHIFEFCDQLMWKIQCTRTLSEKARVVQKFLQELDGNEMLEVFFERAVDVVNIQVVQALLKYEIDPSFLGFKLNIAIDLSEELALVILHSENPIEPGILGSKLVSLIQCKNLTIVDAILETERPINSEWLAIGVRVAERHGFIDLSNKIVSGDRPVDLSTISLSPEDAEMIRARALLQELPPRSDSR